MYTQHIHYTQNMTRNHINISTNCMRSEDRRSESRIIRNRIRRQQELTKNFMFLTITIFLITVCSFSLSAFHSNAKDNAKTAYKYYKSISVSHNDTLWSIAEKYMDKDHYDSITDYINEIKSMNSLTNDSIHYGKYIVIPYYDSNNAE